MVDARIGPGIKSMTKFKKRKEEQQQQQTASDYAGAANGRNNSVSERLTKMFKKKKRVIKSPTKTAEPMSLDDSSPTSPMSLQSDSGDENRSSDGETGSLAAKRLSPNELGRAQRARGPRKNRRTRVNAAAPFASAGQWTAVASCRGLLLEHKFVAAAAPIVVACEQLQVIISAQPARVEPPLPVAVDAPVKLPTPTFNKSLPPKKQFRQCMIDAVAMAEAMQSAPIDYSLPAVNDQPQDLSKKSATPAIDGDGARSLHKTRADAGKVTKKSTARLTPKKKLTDISMVKNLVKLCTDKTASNKKLAAAGTPATATAAAVAVAEPAAGIENIAAAANKYSDNSSDSGYDETLQDSSQAGKGHVQRHSVILPNGMKVQLNPENIVYTAKVVGAVPSVIQSAPVG